MRTEKGLYEALEALLSKSNKPMDCNDLWEHAEVQQYASNVNRVSDYLGNMWRKGWLTRLPNQSTDRTAARWTYQWVGKNAPTIDSQPIVYKGKSRPNISIDETTNEVTIDLSEFTIVVRPKNLQS